MSASGYQLLVDQITEPQWSNALDTFRDANIYQTWSYGEQRWGSQRISRLVVKRDGKVVAMAQTALVRAWSMRMGIAQLRWGPLVRPTDVPVDADAARIMADALHAEYVRRRGLYLRVLAPGWNPSENATALTAAFAAYATEPFAPGESYRTMVVDLRQSPQAIRARLDQKWRNQLNRAERNALTVSEPVGSDAFASFARLYEQMVERKGIAAADVRQFERMQEQLPGRQQLKVLICSENGAPVAGLVASAIGRTGIYLLGATNEQGMKSKGAYLLQWRMMLWLKQVGAEFYDLGGINPDTNPGVYHFKQGMGGEDVRYIAPLVAFGSTASRLIAGAFRLSKKYRSLPGAPSSARAR